MAGPEVAAELLRGARRGDQHLLGLRVHLALVRREEHVAARALELLAIFGERAGIALEIAARLELEAVHEDRGGHALSVAVRGLDEREVARVEVPHRGDEGDGRLALQPRAQLGDGVDEIQFDARSSARARGRTCPSRPSRTTRSRTGWTGRPA
jgi:hypothetical protein